MEATTEATTCSSTVETYQNALLTKLHSEQHTNTNLVIDAGSALFHQMRLEHVQGLSGEQRHALQDGRSGRLSRPPRRVAVLRRSDEHEWQRRAVLLKQPLCLLVMILCRKQHNARCQ